MFLARRYQKGSKNSKFSGKPTTTMDKTLTEASSTGSPNPEPPTFSLQDISIPEQKSRVGLPPGVASNNTSINGNNCQSFNYNNYTPYASVNFSDVHYSILNPPSSLRRELESQILRLWKKVWLGLYQIESAQGPYHYERIEALYLGAGLTRAYRVGELKVLNQHFSEYSRNHGIVGLKLYEGLSAKRLKAVVEILQAYEKEIPNLEQIYTVLREAQLTLHQVDGYGGYTAHIHQTQRRYLDVAEPLEKRLIHYDARMDVLNMDIYDEAMDVHGFHPGLRKGPYVHQKAFGRC